MKFSRMKRPSRAVPRSNRLHCQPESLESRRLLSVEPAGLEFQVNSYTPSDQRLGDAPPYAAASDADGDRVVVWSSLGQDGDSWGVFGQRYAQDGTSLGSEFRVNTRTSGAQLRPTVASDSDGDFIVVWASHSQDGDGYGIYAQRFSGSGEKQGLEFRVNQSIAGDQSHPAVAIDAMGNFVVAWTSPQDGDQDGIVARRYDASGAPRTNEFFVNATTAGNQGDPVVASTLSGRFVIAWESDGQDGDGAGILARRFDADGSAVGDEIAINQNTSGAQSNPALALAADGGFVVAWQSEGQDGDGEAVVARRFSTAGAAVADEVIVNATTVGDQSRPTVALGMSGDYVVAWTSQDQDGDGAGVVAQAFTPDGIPTGGEFGVNTATAADQQYPSIAFDADGDFVVAWHSAEQDGDGLGVFAQRYRQNLADTAAPLATGLYQPGDTHSVADYERLVSAPPQLVVAFSEAMSEAEGIVGASSVLNPANFRLTLFGQDYSAQITSVAYGFNETSHRYEATLQFAAPLPPGVYTLSALASLRDVAGNSLDGDFDGVAGESCAVPFEVAQLAPGGGEAAVNSTTASDQAFTPGAPGTIASDDAGNYVITWASLNQDGGGWGIYAQRFDSAGGQIGDEFRVNTHTTNHQRFSTIAMDADGDFVVTWSSLGQDGGNYGVYAQRYDAAGNPVGGEFRVNTTTNKFQGRSTVAMDDDGDFVIAWESVDQDGSSVGIFYQRYGADGAKRGVETRANTITASAQRLPNVAMDADGDFVITWSGPPDGSGYGIYARRFSADGVAQGAESLANTLTAGNQQDSTVAMDADGDFVVAWHSSTGDGVFYGIYAQRFTAQGEKFGEQFLVNSFTASFQQYPAVALDANGDFVVTWQSLTQDGSVWGVYGQRYRWGGGREGGEFQIHTTVADSQTAANVTMTPRGDFVVAWQSAAQDGGGWGIYSQRYTGLVNRSPQAMLAGPYANFEGEGLALDAGASSDADFGQVLSYAWDLNHDGVFEDAVGATPSLTSVELVALGIADDGVYPISVRVDDGFGGTDMASTSLAVSNAAPVGLALEPLAAIDEGANVHLTGSFSDPGGADLHTLDIDWGDGASESVSLPAGERTFQIAHTYRDDAPTGTPFDPAAIRVTVRDDDAGASEPAETSVEIRNLAPLLEDLQFSKIVLNEGESFTISGRVSDPGADDTHALTFAWADGVVEVVDIDPVTRMFAVSHAYEDDNPTATAQDLINFSFALADDDLGQIVTQAAVTVRNVAPELVDLTLSSGAIDEGGSVTITGRIADVGVHDELTLSIDWGDGVALPVIVDPLARTFSAEHTYWDDDPTGSPADDFTITLQAADDDLGSDQAQFTLHVANVAPTVEIAIAPATPLRGREVALSAVTLDASAADTFVYAWEVRYDELVVASGSDAELRFTPVLSGTYHVQLQVADDDLGTTTTERSFSVCLLPGDTNGDCIVDLADLNTVRNFFGATRGDVAWQNEVGPIPGDANGDDRVDLEDLNLVRNHFGESGLASPHPGMMVQPASDNVSLAQKRTKLTTIDAVFAQIAANIPTPLARRAPWAR